MSSLLELCQVRELYGRGFVSIFPDGLIIPWKPLSLQDYLDYDHDTQQGLIPLGFLENEIFNKCVLNKTIIKQQRFLKAGIVSTVVSHIWNFSGPISNEAFAKDLEMARQLLYGGNSKAIHQLVEVITMAFPYKPEEIYQMDYQTFMIRAAQAEAKLLQAGVLQQPIQLDNNIEQPNLQPPKIDAKALWEEHKSQKKVSEKPVHSKKKSEKWYKKSPVLEAPTKEKIDFKKEQAIIDHIGSKNWDKADQHLIADQMVKDAQVIYADLIQELNAKKNNK